MESSKSERRDEVDFQLSRRITEIERDMGVIRLQLVELQTDGLEQRTDLKTLNYRLFGSINNEGEIVKLQKYIQKATWLLFGGVAVIEFFFSNGFISLKSFMSH